MTAKLRIRIGILLLLAAGLLVTAGAEQTKTREEAELRARLKGISHKIVYETYLDNNWELYMVDADGSNP